MCRHNFRTTSSVSLITMVKRCTLSTSDGEVFRLSMFIFLREKMIAIRLSSPIWFSVYTVIVYSCLLIVYFFLPHSGYSITRFGLIQSLLLHGPGVPWEIHYFLFQPVL